jgi:hypothetical protein
MELDDEHWMVVHEIRLRTARAGDDVIIERLVEVGYAQRNARGVRLTSAGRDAHAVWARLEPGSDVEAAAHRAYERFLPLNRELIRICNDWQVRPGNVPNDHSDLRYDWSVIDRLRALDERAAPVIVRVARACARFDVYRPQLRAALTRVDEGGHEWITSPRCASYHTVWMQLHEDLLLAIGGDRGAEPAP